MEKILKIEKLEKEGFSVYEQEIESEIWDGESLNLPAVAYLLIPSDFYKNLQNAYIEFQEGNDGPIKILISQIRKRAKLAAALEYLICKPNLVNNEFIIFY